MTNPEIISVLQAKLVPWLQANGIEQQPVIEESKNFTPAVGFIPSVDVKWKTATSQLSRSGAIIANYIAAGLSAETAMANVYREVQLFLFAKDRPPSPTWTEFLNPPIVTPTAGVVGPEISPAIVAMQSKYHPQIDPVWRYFQFRGNGAEDANIVADGKRYQVVMPTPFTQWLMLIG